MAKTRKRHTPGSSPPIRRKAGEDTPGPMYLSYYVRHRLSSQMTQPSLLSSITSAVSGERFNPYLFSSSQSETEALGVYAWNITLCESLYPCLNNFEISLRNGIHGAATQKFDQPEWILNNLYRNESEPLERLLQKLTRERKEVNVGDLIANLTLGFWLSLFRSRYEQVLWPGLLEPVFPNCPSTTTTSCLVGWLDR